MRLSPAVSTMPVLALALLTAAGCRNAPPPPATAGGPVDLTRPIPDVNGTERMRYALREFARNADPQADRFLNTARAAWYEKQLEEAVPRGDPREITTLLQNVALEHMNAGNTEKALYVCGELRKMLAANDPQNQSGLRSVPDMLEALTYLRLGETQNCCASASPNACLLPIRDDGVHTRTEGSRKAIARLTAILNNGTDDPGVRWLLNVAYMTLGEYPAKVPAKWLIPPSALKSDYPLKPFPNAAPQLGLDVHQRAGGTIAEDFDNDGDLDLMVSSFGLQDEMHYFVNQGDGTFADRTKEAGLLGQLGGQNLIQADYNNDGWTDFLILRGGWRGKGGHQPKSLLKNNGDGTFSDVTYEARVASPLPCMTAVWFDYDRDGWLDLFLGNESADGETNPCQLFRNNRSGGFVECARDVGLDVVSYVKAATVGDYNRDGLPDLYLSCWKEPNKLFRNDAVRFTDVAKEAGVTEPLGSFSCFFFDYDDDGWDDLFVVDYDIQSVGDVVRDYLKQPHKGETARLFRNRGDGTFADTTKAARLDRVLYGMGLNYGDLDNDGWLDFYVGTGAPNLSALIPNRMFRNDGGKRFQDVTLAGNFGHLQKGHGISWADFDNDGDQDIYESMGGAFEGDTARSVLYENPGGHAGNRWLKLKLEGVRSSRDARGARVAVTLTRARGTARVLHRTVGSGATFGASPLRMEIGLGDATAIRKVEVRWPATGTAQTFTGLAPDRAYVLREGDTAAKPLALRAVRLGGGPQVARK